jgi:hypothetical protein
MNIKEPLRILTLANLFLPPFIIAIKVTNEMGWSGASFLSNLFSVARFIGYLPWLGGLELLSLMFFAIFISVMTRISRNKSTVYIFSTIFSFILGNIVSLLLIISPFLSGVPSSTIEFFGIFLGLLGVATLLFLVWLFF